MPPPPTLSTPFTARAYVSRARVFACAFDKPFLFSSYYSIDGKTLKSSFGIIKSKYDIGTIETVTLDRTTDKLTVSFNNGSFIVIVVKEEWYDDFIDAICKANDKIEYSIKSKENNIDEKK